MKFNSINEKGQALILIALGAVAIFAVVGLAIDGSSKFSDQRHAQNAADTAALEAALSLVNGDTVSWKTNALNRASDNGYTGDLVHNTVEVYLCSETGSECGPYAGNNRYVQVIINSYVDTFFARVIGINQVHNRVQAVTMWALREPLYRGDSIVALNPNPSCPGSFLVGGSGTINLSGGGMYINATNDDCVWEQQGCMVTVNVTGTSADGDPAGITSAGGSIDIDGSCAEQINADTSTDGGLFDFPPEMPELPDECSFSELGTYTNDSTYIENGYTGITRLNPGRYDEFPPKAVGGVTIYDHVFLNPGVYCVSDVVKLVDKKLWLEGSDITIYIRNGSKFSFEGGVIDISASETGEYAGYLIIVDSDFTGAPEECKIDGNTNNSFTGTIFAPYCNVTVNGASGNTSYNAQIIAYEVKLNGNNEINFTYSPDVNRYSDPRIGLMR